MKPAFSKIVVPTDFSDHANQAMRYAESLASELGASLHLVHIVSMSTLPALWGSDVTAPDLPHLQAMSIDDAEHRMERQRKELRNRGIPTTTAVILGQIARAITEYALDLGADLIVMSTHGRTGLAHLTMGSVAEDVVRRASCPVLTIRASERGLPRRGESEGRAAASHAA